MKKAWVFFVYAIACIIMLPFSIIGGMWHQFIHPLILNIVWNNKIILTKFPEFARRYLNMFDSNGLKHELSYLNSLKIVDVISMSIEEMSDFADINVVNGLKNRAIVYHGGVATAAFAYDRPQTDAETELKEKERRLEQGVVTNDITVTGIGNIAYIMLYSENMSEKEDAHHTIFWLRKRFNVQRED